MNRVLLDRDGIFKARPVEWSVQPSKQTKAVAVYVGSVITAQYEDGEWKSWEDYEPHFVSGWWYVIGKDGTVNTTAVEQLAKSLWWDGDLRKIEGEPPDMVVQLTVKSEANPSGEMRRKAQWMNPEDFVPKMNGASGEDVAKLATQYGSLLRAAVAAAAAAPKKSSKK